MIAIVASVVVGVLALAVGALLGYTIRVRLGRGKVEAAEQTASRILEGAEAKPRETLLEAKEEAIRLRIQAETQRQELRHEAVRLERRVVSKEESLDRKTETLDRREQDVTSQHQQVNQQKAELDELRQQQFKEIERVSGLTAG